MLEQQGECEMKWRRNTARRESWMARTRWEWDGAVQSLCKWKDARVCGTYAGCLFNGPRGETRRRRDSPRMDELLKAWSPQLNTHSISRDFLLGCPTRTHNEWKKYGYKTHFNLFSERSYPDPLEDGVPVVVGTTAALGSPYKNHCLRRTNTPSIQPVNSGTRHYDNHGSIHNGLSQPSKHSAPSGLKKL